MWVDSAQFCSQQDATSDGITDRGCWATGSVSWSSGPLAAGLYNLSATSTVLGDATIDVIEVPEPATLAIVAIGLLGFAGLRLRKSRKAA